MTTLIQTEQWRDVDRVSDQGNVWSSGGRWKSPRLLKRYSRRGYPTVNLFCDKTFRPVAVHRLVLEAFAGSCPQGMEGCHNNGIKTDNRWPENLRWDTHPANIRDREMHRVWEPHRGEENPNALISAEQVREIRERHAAGESQRSLARQYPISQSQISLIVRRERWRHVR